MTKSTMLKKLAVLLAFVMLIIVLFNVIKIRNLKLNEKKIIEFLKTKKVNFPPSCKLLNYKYISGFLDDSLFLKIKIKKEELEAFIKSSPFAHEKLYNNQIPSILRFDDTSWWNPYDSRNYLAGEVWLPGAENLAILIDMDNSDLLIIYLCWGET